MRELRLVGPGADSEHVVVETLDGDEQFSLRTDTLHTILTAATPPEAPPEPPAPTPPAPTPPTPTPAALTIPPREIQRRVRAGELPQDVAADAGVSIDRVLLFAAPVLDERSRLAGEARRARARRSTPDGQLVNFGEAVDERFAAHGIDPGAVQWDSHRQEDGQWVVSAGWRGGDADRRADWSFSLVTRTVTPLDETAADLLSDRPIRPVVRAVAGQAPTPRPAFPTTADAITGPLPLGRVPSGPVPSGSLPPEFPPPGPVPSGVSRSDPLPVVPSPFEPLPSGPSRVDRPAVDRPAVDRPTVDRRAIDRRVAGRPPGVDRPAAGNEQLFDTPEAPPLRVVEETEEQKAARARIPSWDDILLGVRRKRD